LTRKYVPSTRIRDGSGANPPIIGLMADMFGGGKMALRHKKQESYMAIVLQANVGVSKEEGSGAGFFQKPGKLTLTLRGTHS
jgi:hypothetical protein